MAIRNSIEPTLVRFARHLHARRGLAETTVHNYTHGKDSCFIVTLVVMFI